MKCQNHMMAGYTRIRYENVSFFTISRDMIGKTQQINGIQIISVDYDRLYELSYIYNATT